MTPSESMPTAPRKKIRLAIVGVGNCASSLIQGRYYYEHAKPGEFVPGLMHVQLGDYHISDIDFVAAFDIDVTKVGKDLSEAIYAGQNNTFKFMDVPHIGVTVERGMTHDGLGKYLSQVIEKAPGPTADVVGILREREVDVMVSYLPVGSEEATKWYVEQALQAGVAVVNAIPVFNGREPYWQRRFAAAGLVLAGLQGTANPLLVLHGITLPGGIVVNAPWEGEIWLLWSLLLIAVLATITTIQRIVATVRQAGKASSD